MKKISLCWFRRDLRIEDQTALFYSLQQEDQVLPLFIFDRHILDALEDKTDARVTFIHTQITSLKAFFEQQGSSMLVRFGHPEEIFKELLTEYEVQSVYPIDQGTC
jgi:deoxyribodipyrimidine photo-lyase